jgi:hypothetical protein
MLSMDKLYHVTYRKNAESIREHGIDVDMGTRNYFDHIYNHNQCIFAFFELEHAAKWREFMINNAYSENEELDRQDLVDVVIVKFEDDLKYYEFDSHWQMEDEGYLSAVYKRYGNTREVPKSQIKDIF